MIENRMVVEGRRIDAQRQRSPERYDCYDGFFCYDKDCSECRDEYDDVRTLCEINSCSDCPRKGDDCDGRYDEEEENDE